MQRILDKFVSSHVSNTAQITSEEDFPDEFIAKPYNHEIILKNEQVKKTRDELGELKYQKNDPNLTTLGPYIFESN